MVIVIIALHPSVSNIVGSGNSVSTMGIMRIRLIDIIVLSVNNIIVMDW